MTAAKVHNTGRIAALAFGAGVRVEPDTGRIVNCSVLTVGPTIGHPFSIDGVTLQQARDLINAKGGVKVRFKHPDITPAGTMEDDAGSVVGILEGTTRIDGDQLRGDVKIGDYAANLPGQGDTRKYLLALAAEHPTSIGLSLVMVWDGEQTAGGLVARVQDVWACDFVGIPAANPNGLLGAIRGQDDLPSNDEKDTMDPKLKAQLCKLGLDEKATDDQARAFMAALSADKQAEVTKLAADGDATPPDKPADKPAASASAALPAAPTVAQLEAKRVDDLTALSAVLERTLKGNTQALAALSAAYNAALVGGLSADQARASFLKACEVKPIAGIGAGDVRVGADRKITALRAAMPESLLLAAGVQVKEPHELAPKYQSVSILDMYRHWLVALGASVDEVFTMPKGRLVDLMGPRAGASHFGVAALAQSSSSFSNILVDAINKAARIEYQLAPIQWPLWARRGTPAPDFKTINRVQISDVASLVSRKEGGEIKYYNLKDSNETYVLVEYANGIRVTRRMLLNDDKDMFSRVPRGQVQAAAQLEDDIVYAVLTANAAMADTGALFNATAVTTTGGHANLDSATAYVGAPSITLLGRGRQLLRVQKAPNGQYLNLEAKTFLVPAALETVAEQLVSGKAIPTQQTYINPFAPDGRTPLQLLVQPRLDASSAYAWYLFGDNSRCDTVEVTFLDGEPEPVLKQESDFDTDDLKLAVRHTCAAKALDWRNMYKNNGTT